MYHIIVHNIWINSLNQLPIFFLTDNFNDLSHKTRFVWVLIRYVLSFFLEVIILLLRVLNDSTVDGTNEN